MKLASGRSAKLANILVALVLVCVPFHAFLTVWGSTLVGHYTALRLWDDVLLTLLVAVSVWWLITDKALGRWFFGSLLVRLILAYGALTILLGFVSLAKGEVTVKAFGYGALVNLRFLIWFLAVLLTAQRSNWLRTVWPRLLLVPAVLVALFAVLQYTVLPHDFLGHFGYDARTTIAPIETINHNTHYIRVQSTLRGANPLGAYLVVVLAAVGTLFMHGRRRLVCVILGLLGIFALFASGSRSAWIGALLALVVAAWYGQTHRQRTIFGIAGLAVIVLAGGAYAVLHTQAGVQNAVLHTQQGSKIATSSNDAHASALSKGVDDVLHQPFGDGPGTAGPASTYNTGHNARIAEDYYVQIAQETGWLGLILFLGILVLVGAELYALVGTSKLALALFAGLVGVSFVNLLSHAWTDDTLAYVWWGLAGIALARPATRTQQKPTVRSS